MVIIRGMDLIEVGGQQGKLVRVVDGRCIYIHM